MKGWGAGLTWRVFCFDHDDEGRVSNSPKSTEGPIRNLGVRRVRDAEDRHRGSRSREWDRRDFSKTEGPGGRGRVRLGEGHDSLVDKSGTD